MSVGGKSGSGPASYGYGQHSGYAPTQQQQNTFNNGVLPSTAQVNQPHQASFFDAGAQGPSFKNPFGPSVPNFGGGPFNSVDPVYNAPQSGTSSNPGVPFFYPPGQGPSLVANNGPQPGQFNPAMSMPAQGTALLSQLPQQPQPSLNPIMQGPTLSQPLGSGPGLGQPPISYGPLGPPVATPFAGMDSMSPQNLFNNYSNTLYGTAPSAYQPNFATAVGGANNLYNQSGPGAAPQALNPQGPTQTPGSDVVFRPS